MRVDLDREEIKRLIILLTQHIVKTIPAGTEDFTHPDGQLRLKLRDAGNRAIGRDKVVAGPPAMDKTKPGGKVVAVWGLKVHVGHECIAAMEQSRAEGGPGAWQTKNPFIKLFMRTVARKAGYPEMFREGFRK